MDLADKGENFIQNFISHSHVAKYQKRSNRMGEMAIQSDFE